MAGPGRDERQQAAAAFGVALPVGYLQDAGQQVAEYGPDDVDAVMLFQALRTQWRVSMAGPVGLDYGVVPWIATQLDIDDERLRLAFGPLRVMEDEALMVFSEQRPK